MKPSSIVLNKKDCQVGKLPVELLLYTETLEKKSYYVYDLSLQLLLLAEVRGMSWLFWPKLPM